MEVETDKIANAGRSGRWRPPAPARRRGRAGLSGQGAARRHRADQRCPTPRSTPLSRLFELRRPRATTRRKRRQATEFVETPTRPSALRQRAARATPIVLIHGFGGDLDNWLFNIDALAEAGAGLCARPAGPWRLDQDDRRSRTGRTGGCSRAFPGGDRARKRPSGRPFDGRRRRRRLGAASRRPGEIADADQSGRVSAAEINSALYRRLRRWPNRAAISSRC